ncbi:MAG: glycine zipper 2TM domain-containing protein [Alphaproteobacteria bacterium]|nr:glycine zipper 2TM domain-containing protein [Alphaproteobacteria bacterium]
MKDVITSIFFCGLLFLSGCSRDISSDSYEATTLDGPALHSYACTVVSVRKVKISAHDSLEQNTTGGIIGGVAGGLAGNMIGQGKGRILATGLGALAGAAGGAYAEKKLKEQVGYEYVVQLENGSMRTIVQGPNGLLSPGQAAILIEGRNGRSRLIARS